MNERILFVDDDENLLSGYQRQLRKRFRMDTALGGKEGLIKVTNRDPYAVIVSDLRMPGMDGIEFLARVREISPDTVRMMLTGFADLETAIEAVNEGNIFRFLTKPCHPDVLAKAIEASVEQYRLIVSEKDLLEKTLSGGVKVLSEVLSMLNPEAFGRSTRITPHIREIAFWLGVSDVWKLETAAMLSQIGCILLPDGILNKIYRGDELKEEEWQLFNMHPSIASDLVGHIPRMEEVGKIIAYQEKHYDGSGIPADEIKGDEIPLGSRVLKVVLDFDMLRRSGTPRRKAVQILKEREGWYDPAVLSALEAVERLAAKYYKTRSVKLNELRENMVLAQDLKGVDGSLIFPKGQQVNRPLLERLRNFAKHMEINEPIQVFGSLEERVQGPPSEQTKAQLS